MKKRTAFIGAILSLIPLGQPLLIGTGAVFISSAVIHSLSAKAEKNNAQFYYERGGKKLDKGIYKGAISDYTKAIEINPEYEDAYYDRGFAKEKKHQRRTSMQAPIIFSVNAGPRTASRSPRQDQDVSGPGLGPAPGPSLGPGAIFLSEQYQNLFEICPDGTE